MSKANRKVWAFYGGIIGIVALTLLLLLASACIEYFAPQAAHASQAESFALAFFFGVPCGFIFGAIVGNEIAPKSKVEKIDFFKQSILFIIVAIVCNYGLSRIWVKPEAAERPLYYVAWELLPLFLAAWLWKLIRRKENGS